HRATRPFPGQCSTGRQWQARRRDPGGGPGPAAVARLHRPSAAASPCGRSRCPARLWLVRCPVFALVIILAVLAYLQMGILLALPFTPHAMINRPAEVAQFLPLAAVSWPVAALMFLYHWDSDVFRI